MAGSTNRNIVLHHLNQLPIPVGLLLDVGEPVLHHLHVEPQHLLVAETQEGRVDLRAGWHRLGEGRGGVISFF